VAELDHGDEDGDDGTGGTGCGRVSGSTVVSGRNWASGGTVVSVGGRVAVCVLARLANQLVVAAAAWRMA